MLYSITEQNTVQIFVLDSCVGIEVLKNSRVARKIVALKGKHSRIAMQDVILSEVQKKTGLKKDEILRRISAITGRVVQIFSTSEVMMAEAKKIERKYGICHFPDSIILASCKLFTWTLLTFDRNMLRTAEFEGIMAFNPIKEEAS